MPTYPEATLQTVIQNTDGVLVQHDGNEGYFHVKTPTAEDIFALGGGVQGHAITLVGSKASFPTLTEGDVITVTEGDAAGAYYVAEWKIPEYRTIHIALKTSTRD